MKLKKHTLTSDMSPTDISLVVRETVKWCKSNMGVYNRRQSGKFNYRVRPMKKKELIEAGGPCMGRFYSSTNTLVIFPEHNDSVRELIETTIHEYTHYLQPLTKYNKLSVQYGYNKHPQEVEARKNERKLFGKCFKSVSLAFKK
jgi:hypothetical protein